MKSITYLLFCLCCFCSFILSAQQAPVTNQSEMRVERVEQRELALGDYLLNPGLVWGYFLEKVKDAIDGGDEGKSDQNAGRPEKP